MAQLTVRDGRLRRMGPSSYFHMQSIYPLIVFILVALDKVHHSRGSRNLCDDDWPNKRGAAVTVTLEVDVERSAARNSTSAPQMPLFLGANDKLYPGDDTKLPVPSVSGP